MALQLDSQIGTIARMFAVVLIAGKQYKVEKGMNLSVDRLEGTVGDSISFPHVLLVEGDKGKVDVGTPTVKGFTVKAKIVNHVRGEKLSIRRYKSKVRYRRKTGFRAELTTLEITEIAKA